MHYVHMHIYARIMSAREREKEWESVWRVKKCECVYRYRKRQDARWCLAHVLVVLLVCCFCCSKWDCCVGVPIVMHSHSVPIYFCDWCKKEYEGTKKVRTGLNQDTWPSQKRSNVEKCWKKSNKVQKREKSQRRSKKCQQTRQKRQHFYLWCEAPARGSKSNKCSISRVLYFEGLVGGSTP